MARARSKQLGSKSQFAGEFRVEKFTIINHTGTKVSLEESFVEMNIYESINQNCVSADIIFLDTNDVVNLLPIVGNEFVQILISTPATTKTGSIDYTKHTFVIKEVTAAEDAGQGKGIAMTLVTQEMLTNSRVRVSQAYSGAYSEMVEKIFTSPNYLNSKKILNVEETSGSHNLVVPNMKPFKAISMIAQRSLSDRTTPTYVFYETTKGYHFRSLESLYEQSEIGTYTAGIGDDNANNADAVGTNLYQIEKHTFISNSDMLIKTMTGMFSSKIIVHDIYNKSFKTQTFSYQDDFEKGFDTDALGGKQGNPIFPTKSILDDKENTVSDFSDAQVQVQSTSGSGNIFATGTYPNARTPYGKSNPEQDLITRRAKLGALQNGFTLNVTITGNTAIQAGDMMNVKIYKTGSKVGDMFDKRLSGRYMISKLRHYFSRRGDKKHRVIAELSKNSVGEAYPNNLPPSPKGTGGVKRLSA